VMKKRTKKLLVVLGLFITMGLFIGGCGQDQTSSLKFEYPDMVKVEYVRERIGVWDPFIDQLLPSDVELRNAEVKKSASGYTFSFFFDDVYPVTQYDAFSNRLLGVVSTDNGMEPALSEGDLALQGLSYHGRQYEQVIQPGKVYKLAIVLLTAYGGTPNHSGQIVVARITVDTTTLK
jgi:hypothetical protein